MRVALNVEQLLQPSPGGIGRYTAALGRLLPTLFPDDDLVPFAAWHSRTALAEVAERLGVPAVHRLPAPRPLLYEGWTRAGFPPLVAGGTALRGIDVVHAPSVAVPPRSRSALVVTVHDVAATLFPHTYPPRGRRFHEQGVAAAAERADLVITVSEAAAAEIAAHSGIERGRVRVVPNGVSPPPADRAASEAALRRLGLAGRRYLLWVGSLEPRKGVDTLVSAFADLRRRGRAGDVTLVLAGHPGWLSDGLVDPGDLGDGLRRLGEVPEADLWALYGGAELCAVPSRHEGFGLPVLEAMSQGVPVLCSDLPVLREVGGDAPRYVAVGDAAAWTAALGELLGDRAARKQMATAGRARAAEFTWERSVRATRAVYEEARSLRG